MGPAVYVSGAVEGTSDEPVLKRIIEATGARIHRVQVLNGKPNLRRVLPGYNEAAKRAPWLVLVDLDQSFVCPAALVTDWLPQASRYMRFRVVVRQVEGWLMADGERFAQFFSVRRAALSNAPDGLLDAKTELLRVIGTSRKKAIRSDMLPRAGSGRRVGPAYVSRLIEFASDGSSGWRPEVAAGRSPSLARCLVRLKELVAGAP